jgi:hypothetical protein
LAKREKEMSKVLKAMADAISDALCGLFGGAKIKSTKAFCSKDRVVKTKIIG